MERYIAIGIAAGAASALLAAGVAAGSVLAVPLFYLAPLPVMIAGLAFSHFSALVAMLAATAGLGAVFGLTFLSAYAVGIGGPAFGLAYLALLARPEPAAKGGLVWFPVGGLVVATAVFSTIAIIVALFSMAGDYETYRQAVTTAFDALMRAQAEVPGAATSPQETGADPAALSALLARLLPPMAGITSMMSLMGCLYLAGRAAVLSERLARPWPDLAAWKLPTPTSLVLAVLVALSMAPGLLGLSASVGVATVTGAYALAGFAVVHFLTRGSGARVLILTSVWLGALLLGWPVLIMAVLGFADAVFDLRARAAARRGPPAANDR